MAKIWLKLIFNVKKHSKLSDTFVIYKYQFRRNFFVIEKKVMTSNFETVYFLKFIF
jgi:hypothetical protein